MEVLVEEQYGGVYQASPDIMAAVGVVIEGAREAWIVLAFNDAVGVPSRLPQLF